MAIDKEQMAATMAGLPTKESILAGEGVGIDSLQASIVSPETGEEQGAKLTEGEYVLDIPSIVGLDALLGGEGTYEGGLAQLEQLHETLRNTGLEILNKQGLGSVGS